MGIQDLLLDRYQTHYLGLLFKTTLPFADIYPANSMKGRQGRYTELSSKPCSYSNNLANARPTNGKVSSPIKVKIQNAINRALQGDTDESGVIVVGGRRRNRKRRPNKNKPTKNETKKPKKTKKTSKKSSGDSSSDSSDKENGHSFSIYAALTKATSAGRRRDDQKPLIGSYLDGKEFDDREEDSGFWTPDTENDDHQDSDTMPFGFGKKKKAALIEKDVSPPPQEVVNTEIVVEKVEESPINTEDATIKDAEPITVTEMVVEEEETMVEMVTSDAVDGGAEQMVVETEMVEETKQETIEKEPEPEEPATILEETVEPVKEDVVMTEEPVKAVEEVVASEKIETELVPPVNNVSEGLAVEPEVMSVDLNELDDDEEVAILDRFEMLGQPVEPAPIETIVEKPGMEDPAPIVAKQPKKQPRVESTPLIRKQPTKVKDQQPGFLCCTII